MEIHFLLIDRVRWLGVSLGSTTCVIIFMTLQLQTIIFSLELIENIRVAIRSIDISSDWSVLLSAYLNYWVLLCELARVTLYYRNHIVVLWLLGPIKACDMSRSTAYLYDLLISKHRLEALILFALRIILINTFLTLYSTNHAKCGQQSFSDYAQFILFIINLFAMAYATRLKNCLPATISTVFIYCCCLGSCPRTTHSKGTSLFTIWFRFRGLKQDQSSFFFTTILVQIRGILASLMTLQSRL